MSKHHIEKVTCPSCHHEGDFEVWDSINTVLDPAMKEKVLNQSIFLYTCPSCGETFRLNYSTLYHQMEDLVMIYLVPESEVKKTYEIFYEKNALADYRTEKYLYRIVTSANQLVEKIQIFDAGKDDRVMELVKLLATDSILKNDPDIEFDELRFAVDDDGTNILVIINKGEITGGLIEKRRQGFGKVNVIYVKTFMPEKTDEKKFEEELKKFKKQTSVENEEPAEVYNSNFMKSQNQTSRSPENKLQEVYISNPNNTNLSDTEMNDNKSNHIISVDEKRFDSDNRSEDYQAYENLVKETIDYESLEVTHRDDMRQVDEIVNLIVETVMCKNDKILIASNWYPASLVKKKFLMLTYSHIEYVLHCMSGNTTKVKNIKKYLLAALFNAPSTMNGYYQAEVNHDMPGLVR